MNISIIKSNDLISTICKVYLKFYPDISVITSDNYLIYLLCCKLSSHSIIKSKHTAINENFYFEVFSSIDRIYEFYNESASYDFIIHSINLRIKTKYSFMIDDINNISHIHDISLYKDKLVHIFDNLKSYDFCINKKLSLNNLDCNNIILLDIDKEYNLYQNIFIISFLNEKIPKWVFKYNFKKSIDLNTDIKKSNTIFKKSVKITSEYFQSNLNVKMIDSLLNNPNFFYYKFITKENRYYKNNKSYIESFIDEELLNLYKKSNNRYGFIISFLLKNNIKKGFFLYYLYRVFYSYFCFISEKDTLVYRTVENKINYFTFLGFEFYFKLDRVDFLKNGEVFLYEYCFRVGIPSKIDLEKGRNVSLLLKAFFIKKIYNIDVTFLTYVDFTNNKLRKVKLDFTDDFFLKIDFILSELLYNVKKGINIVVDTDFAFLYKF